MGCSSAGRSRATGRRRITERSRVCLSSDNDYGNVTVRPTGRRGKPGRTGPCFSCRTLPRRQAPAHAAGPLAEVVPGGQPGRARPRPADRRGPLLRRDRAGRRARVVRRCSPRRRAERSCVSGRCRSTPGARVGPRCSEPWRPLVALPSWQQQQAPPSTLPRPLPQVTERRLRGWAQPPRRGVAGLDQTSPTVPLPRSSPRVRCCGCP